MKRNFTHCPDEEGTEIGGGGCGATGTGTTSLIAPMRRGLKCTFVLFCGSCPNTSLIAPMRRGLKLPSCPPFGLPHQR